MEMDNKISTLLGKTVVQKTDKEEVQPIEKMKLLIQENKEQIAESEELLQKTKERIFDLQEREKLLQKALGLIDDAKMHEILSDVGWKPEERKRFLPK